MESQRKADALQLWSVSSPASKRFCSATVVVDSVSSPISLRPSIDSVSSRPWLTPWVADQPLWASSRCDRLCVIGRVPRQGDMRAVGQHFALAHGSGVMRKTARWPVWNAMAVARLARCHSAPKGAPDPQDTITGRRPEVISNARVEACAPTPARPSRRFCGIDNHRGAPAMQPRKAHRKPGAGHCLDTGIRPSA